MSSQPPYGSQSFQGGGFPPQPPPPVDSKTKVLNMGYNTAGLLCYIPTCCCLINVIACILWVASEPRQNRFLRFHSIQGLLLAGVWIVLWLVFAILGIALGVSMQFTPGGGMAGAGGSLLLYLIRVLIGLVLLIIHIVAMIKANQGQMWKLPVIGDIAEKNA